MEDDWFVIDIDQTTDLTVDLESPDQMDMVLWIEKDEGEQVVWEREIDDGEEGVDEQDTFTAEAGRYYLNVYEYNGHWSQSPYQLKITGLVPVETVELDQHEIVLFPDETVQLQATLFPDNATNTAVSWVSSDEELARVDDGLVVAVAPGTVWITASAEEASDQCELTVKPTLLYDFEPQEAYVTQGGYSIVLQFEEELSDTLLEDTLRQQMELSRGDDAYATLADEDKITVDGQCLIIELQQPLSGDNNHLKVAAGTILNQAEDRANAEIEASLPVTEACFIATAAYGSYLDPHVEALRDFRDQVLLKSKGGQWFVDQYYRFSPPLAALIAAHPIVRGVTRGLLTPLVLGIAYPAAAMGLLLLAFLVRWKRRRIYS
jgi:hypothetical protein